MNEAHLTVSQQPSVAETPRPSTVRTLSARELSVAGGGVLIGLLLPAVQKVREAAAR